MCVCVYSTYFRRFPHGFHDFHVRETARLAASESPLAPEINGAGLCCASHGNWVDEKYMKINQLHVVYIYI